MEFLPIFLDVREQPCLVVGGGEVAARKAALLVRAGARVTTIVFYMGLLGVDVLCRELAAHGLPGATPAALIQQGTTPQQRVLTGTLVTLPDIVRQSDVRAPTLIIVGEVVKLRDRLKWFEAAA